MKFHFLKKTAGLLIILILLSGCFGSGEQEVIDQFEESISNIETGRMSFSLKLDSGSSEGGVIQESMSSLGDVDLTFDRTDESNPKTELVANISLDGYFGEETLSGNLDAEFLMFGGEPMLRVNALYFNHPQFIALEPFLDSYMGEWLRFGQELVGEELQAVLLANQEGSDRRNALLESFQQVNMLQVVEDYGLETLEGREVHHYQVEVDRDALRQHIENMAEYDDIDFSGEDLESGAELADSVQMELWIDSETFHLVQASLLMTNFSLGGVTELGQSNMVLDLFVKADPFNQPVDIQRPFNVRAFDPSPLLLGIVSLLSVDDSELNITDDETLNNDQSYDSQELDELDELRSILGIQSEAENPPSIADPNDQ